MPDNSPFLTVRALLPAHPDIRPPVVEGLVRQVETLNIIGPPKSR